LGRIVAESDANYCIAEISAFRFSGWLEMEI
jgi:hypothetical protein